MVAGLTGMWLLWRGLWVDVCTEFVPDRASVVSTLTLHVCSSVVQKHWGSRDAHRTNLRTDPTRAPYASGDPRAVA